MDALAENTKITSNFLEVSVGWLLQDGFCIKVPLCHLKWSKTRDIRDIKASKASGHLLHLAAAEMQQSLSRHQGIAHRF